MLEGKLERVVELVKAVGLEAELWGRIGLVVEVGAVASTKLLVVGTSMDDGDSAAGTEVADTEVAGSGVDTAAGATDVAAPAATAAIGVVSTEHRGHSCGIES